MRPGRRHPSEPGRAATSARRGSDIRIVVLATVVTALVTVTVWLATGGMFWPVFPIGGTTVALVPLVTARRAVLAGRLRREGTPPAPCVAPPGGSTSRWAPPSTPSPISPTSARAASLVFTPPSTGWDSPPRHVGRLSLQGSGRRPPAATGAVSRHELAQPVVTLLPAHRLWPRKAPALGGVERRVATTAPGVHTVTRRGSPRPAA
jgi:hypothetical protein